MKRIIIVDQQKLFAATVATLIEKNPDWSVVDMFHNGQDAVNHIPERYADLALMALDLPTLNGLESCRHLSQQLPIILWEHFWSPSLIKMAKAQGAAALLTKDIHSQELRHAIQAVLNGQSFYSASITEMLL